MQFIIIAFLIVISNIVCLAIGINFGQKICRGDRVKLSGPVTYLKEKAAEKEEEQSREAIEDMIHNINVYDGTDAHQRDIK